jgi:hypothetical protein
VKKYKLYAAIAFLLMFFSGLALEIWWPISHNALNNGCHNNIYYYSHIDACNQFDLHSGIINGFAITGLCVGIFGAIVSAVWFAATDLADSK